MIKKFMKRIKTDDVYVYKVLFVLAQLHVVLLLTEKLISQKKAI